MWTLRAVAIAHDVTGAAQPLLLEYIGEESTKWVPEKKKKRNVVSAAFHCNLQAAGHVNFTRPSLGFFSFPPFLILALFHPLRDGGRRLRQRHRGWRCAIQSEVTQQHPT